MQEFGNETDEKYDPAYKVGKYSTVYTTDLKASLDTLVEKIIVDVRDNGVRTVILDDRDLNADNKVMPMLMVVGRLSSSLLEAQLRQLVSIVVSTGEVFDPHSAATMIRVWCRSDLPLSSLLYSRTARRKHR